MKYEIFLDVNLAWRLSISHDKGNGEPTTKNMNCALHFSEPLAKKREKKLKKNKGVTIGFDKIVKSLPETFAEQMPVQGCVHSDS